MIISEILSKSEVKQKFSEYTGMVTNHPVGEVLALPISDRTKEVAIAFDYLLRFYVEFLNEGKMIEKRTWYAEEAFYHNYVQSGYFKEDPTEEEESVVAFYKDLEVRHESSMIIYEQYTKDGVITDELMSFCLLLAKFELGNKVFSGDMVDSFTEPTKKSIKDLKNIFALVKPDPFLCNRKCFLNPTFGLGNENADLIIDDTLIEIKTVTRINWTDFKKHVNQLLVYYLLSLIGQINGKFKRSPIKYFGIYYSRHGLYWREPIAAALNTNKFVREICSKFPLGDNERLIDYDIMNSIKEIHKDPMVVELKEWFVKYVPKEKLQLN